MKIVVFEQEHCGWCTRLHPHINKLAKDFEVPIEFIDIQDNWELAKQYNFRTTPAVVLEDQGVYLRKFIIDTDKGISKLIADIKDFITA